MKHALAESPAVGFANVSRFLAPRSIAVIGASDQPGNVGGAAVRFCRKFNSPCAIYPVNPNRSSVAGLPCFPNVAVLPTPPDLAILALPAAAIAQAIRDCAAAGIDAGIVWAGGFVEGGPDGLARHRELLAVCRETGFAMLGPNCLGVIETHAPITASFASMMQNFDRFIPGNISMVSQSGGLATMALALAQQAGCGFRYMISTGNEAVLGVSDFLRALADDPLTKIIALYLEGVRDGAKFQQALAAARRAGKPVVVLKAGDTTASAVAAAAHTGALAGEGRVWDAVLREHAAIRVESLQELLDVALCLSGADLTKLPQNRGVALITFGGGSGVLSADQCDRIGLAVPSLTEATREALKELASPLASTRNPVDLTPQTYLNEHWFSLFPRALDTIAQAPEIGTIFFQLGPMTSGDREMADMVADFRARSSKPVLVAWPLMLDAARDRFRASSMHVLPEYSRGVKVIGRLADYAEATSAPRDTPARMTFDWQAAVPVPRAGLVVSEDQCHVLLARAGIPIAEGRLATSESDAAEFAEWLGFPVAMKGISSAVTHRAAAGLVVLSLKSPSEAREAWARVQTEASRNSVRLDGVYVQRMVGFGVEILVSAYRDPIFGVMVSIGAGGGMTELIDDVVLMPAPFAAAAAARALRRLRIVRKSTSKSVNVGALANYVSQVSRLAATAPWRRFVLEINPIKWSADQAVAVDGLLIIEEP